MKNLITIDLEKAMNKLEDVRIDCEYICDEIRDAEDEDMLKDTCIYGVSLVDSMIYSLNLVKCELNKEIRE